MDQKNNYVVLNFFSWKTASELPLKQIDLLDGSTFLKRAKQQQE